MHKLLIYLIGVAALGLAYAWLKSTLGAPVAFAVAITYLAALRLLAERVGK